MSRLFALYILIIWVTVYFLLQNSKSSRPHAKRPAAQCINKVAVATLLSFSLAALQKATPFAAVCSGKEGIFTKFLANHRTCRWFAI